MGTSPAHIPISPLHYEYICAQSYKIKHGITYLINIYLAAIAVLIVLILKIPGGPQMARASLSRRATRGRPKIVCTAYFCTNFYSDNLIL